MSNMIKELKFVDNILTDELQVKNDLFLQSSEHMAVNMMHNHNIKTFEDIRHCLELEEDRLGQQCSNHCSPYHPIWGVLYWYCIGMPHQSISILSYSIPYQ